MSYKKVQQLAVKFANTSYSEQFQGSRTDPFANDFIRNIRIALNELEGDLMTLKYREVPFNRVQFKELGNFWRAATEIYKNIDEYKLEKGILEFVALLNEKKEWLEKIMPAIQKHMKNTEVDFVPGPGLTQARADGLKELIKAVKSGADYLKNNIPTPAQSETIRPGSSKPNSSPIDETRIVPQEIGRNAL